MKQPKHVFKVSEFNTGWEIELHDDFGLACDLGYAKTELSAWKAAARRLHRLAKEAESEVKRLEGQDE